MKNKKLRPWCYHPFTNLTIESGGKLRMCCASMTHTVGEVNEISNIEDFWLNSPEMDVIRTDMLDHNLDGPANLRDKCASCISNESRGLHSKRQRYIEQFEMNRKDLIDQDMWDPKIRDMDLAFSRTCNFQCATCSSAYSSKWFVDDRKRNKLKIVSRIPEIVDVIGINPLLKQDKVLQLSEIASRGAVSVVFKGGEPFLDSNFKYYQQNVKDKYNKTLSVVTNGSVYDEELLDLLMEYRKIWITFSIDGIEDIHCWIRNSTKEQFENLLKNGKYIKGKNFVVNINSVISAFNIFTIDKLAEYLVKGDHEIENIDWFSFHAVVGRPFETASLFLRTHQDIIVQKLRLAAQQFPEQTHAYQQLNAAANHYSLPWQEIIPPHNYASKVRTFLINYDSILVPSRGSYLEDHDELFGEALFELRKYNAENPQ